MPANNLPDRVQRQAIRAGKITRHESCTKKHAFTRDKAVRQAKRRRDMTGEEIYAYPCIFCDAWHLGHLIK